MLISFMQHFMAKTFILILHNSSVACKAFPIFLSMKLMMLHFWLFTMGSSHVRFDTYHAAFFDTLVLIFGDIKQEFVSVLWNHPSDRVKGR